MCVRIKQVNIRGNLPVFMVTRTRVHGNGVSRNTFFLKNSAALEYNFFVMFKSLC